MFGQLAMAGLTYVVLCDLEDVCHGHALNSKGPFVIAEPSFVSPLSAWPDGVVLPLEVHFQIEMLSCGLTSHFLHSTVS